MVQFGLGTEKNGLGGVDEKGNLKTVVNDPWTLGKLSEERANYTAEAISEAHAAAQDYVAVWTPIVKGAFLDNNKVKHDAKVVKTIKEVNKDVVVEILYKDFNENDMIPAAEFPAGGEGVEVTYKVAYKYDNVVIPQEKLPTLIAKMQGISLEARARRIAIQYSQIAALQMKQDYGMDFESMIAEQAQAELQLEIDNEAVFMLRDAAENDATIGKFEWTDEELDTLAYSLKAEGFARTLERAKQDIYKRTQKLAPTWMLCSPDIMPILTFVPGFKAAGSVKAVGPYKAGTINGLDVIISPALIPDAKADAAGVRAVCYLGVLGNDGKTATGVFAPYAPLIPTQLLGYADGTMSQGWSSLYDMKILNSALMTKITVKKGNDHAAVDTYAQSANEI